MTVQADADVLVLGGGPAGTWAAVAAAEAGARVILADKGYCGTSGAAAAGGNNVWYVPPDAAAREASIVRRTEQGGRLTSPEWMLRTVDRAYSGLADLAAAGYPFPADAEGRPLRGSLQGPQYLRTMRRRVWRAGVRIMDHSPALHLLTDPDGAVAGAAGQCRQDGDRPWQVRASAVVIATGGCAFLSGSLGTNVDTGDGHLMAAEAGAVLSGMEFSAAYALAPAFGAATKGLMMQFATYYGDDGRVLDVGDRDALARIAATGEQLHARLDKAPEHLRAAARQAQPNYFLPLDKAGIDPFTTAYPIRFVLEGTVRGTGGLALTSDDCATGVPGLYAAGDAATREYVTGAVSGGGSHNAAWAIASGSWAGAGAAAYARRRGARAVPRPSASGRAAVPTAIPTTVPAAVPAAELIAAVQAEVLPLDRNYFRTGAGLRAALTRLDGLWRAAKDGPVTLADRQALAMLAHARWMYAAALARPESRGLHRRDDHPGSRPEHTHRITVGGLDEVWTST